MFENVKNIFKKGDKSLPHEVFISYSTMDKEFADEVCQLLESNGFKCWIGPRDLPSGVNYAETIINAIKSSRVFVILFSKHANESQYVNQEITVAFQSEIKVIPVRIDDSLPYNELEFYLSRLRWIDAYYDKPKAFELLVESIRKLLRD